MDVVAGDDAIDIESLVTRWFQAWETGDYREIPVTDDFTHVSPFGTVDGKEPYLRLVAANEEAFLGFEFEIHDAVYAPRRACVRYTARSGSTSLAASEWFFGDGNGISKIISYYNVGDVSYSSFD